MLVIDDSRYGRNVPLQVGTLHIIHILDLMTLQELDRLNKQWTRGKKSRIIAATVACKETYGQNKGRFYLDKVAGEVKLNKTITLALFKTEGFQGITEVQEHHKQVNAVTEPPIKRYSCKDITRPIKIQLEPASQRTKVFLQNLTTRSVKVRDRTVVAQVSAANIVLPMLVPEEGLSTSVQVNSSVVGMEIRTPNSEHRDVP